VDVTRDTGQPMPMPDGSMASAMPQDLRAGPDGRHFYVADMLEGGVFVTTNVSPSTTDRSPTRFRVPATNLAVAQWASCRGRKPRHSFHRDRYRRMGNLSTDGTELWLSERYDGEVYVFDTVHGVLAARIPVGNGPHGLKYWPQPGRYSLGHTGNMR
jgi:hypothetical protein